MSLNQDFQEQKRSSAALVPLEIPRKPWPCTFFVRLPPSWAAGGKPMPPVARPPAMPPSPVMVASPPSPAMPGDGVAITWRRQVMRGGRPRRPQDVHLNRG